MKEIFYEGAIPSELIADSINKHASKTEIGAHQIFLGQVRGDVINNAKVVGIEYTSYKPLALEKMHQIREEVIQKYDLTCMHVLHSLGFVKVGELCLFVFTSSSHRAAATSACAETVERIKAELPIWGKEILEDLSYQWKKNG